MGIRRRLHSGIAALRTRDHPWLEPAALVAVVAVFVVALVAARGLRQEASLFPVAISVVGLVFGSLALARVLFFPGPAVAAGGRGAGDLDADETAELPDGPDIASPTRFWFWFAGFVFAAYGFGFYVGVPVITGLFVLVESRKWLTAVLVGLGMWGYLYWIFLVVFGIAWSNGVFL